MANLPVAECTPEQEQRLRQIAADAYSNWKSQATEEIRQQGYAEVEKFKNDPDYATTRLAAFEAMFAEADADGNGRLNRQEFFNLMAKVEDEARAKG